MDVPIKTEDNSIAEFDLADNGRTIGSGWASDLQPGSENDAARLWRRYHVKLISVAQQRLRMSPQRLADGQDVVVSAFRSFFRAVREERVSDNISENELWRLLVTLTIRKAIKVLRHEGRLVRDSRAVDADQGVDDIISNEPEPEFAAALVEEFRQFNQMLPDDEMRLLAQRKMEGYGNAEIARELDCSIRTVKRRLALMRALLNDAISAQEKV